MKLQQIRGWQNVFQWWLDVNTHMMLDGSKCIYLAAGPYRLNRISKLRNCVSKVSRHLKRRRCWKKLSPTATWSLLGCDQHGGDLTVFHCMEPASEQSLRSQFTKGLPMNCFPRGTPFSCKRDYPCLEHWRRGRVWPLHLILDSLGWGLYINRGIWDTFIRCWAAGFSRLLLPVFLAFVLFSKAVLGLFLLKCHPDQIGVFRIFLLLVLLLPHFHSVFLYMLFCCCTHSLIHSLVWLQWKMLL